MKRPGAVPGGTSPAAFAYAAFACRGPGTGSGLNLLLSQLGPPLVEQPLPELVAFEHRLLG